MDQKQIDLVQTSFAQIQPIEETAAALFYDRLFVLDPALKPLFTRDIHEQGRVLMSMIRVVVNGLDRLDQIVPAVQMLGKRHSTYGVVDPHYDTVGAALLWTLEQGLGESFTPEVRDAWTAAYVLLATTMKAAAAGAGDVPVN